MPHGGRRAGAGRRTLSERQRLLIGAEAETVYRTDRTLLPLPGLDPDEVVDIEASRAEMRGPDRKLAEMHLAAALDGRRVRKAVRPSLPKVCDRIAAEATKALDKPITGRQVRRWRQDYLDTKK